MAVPKRQRFSRTPGARQGFRISRERALSAFPTVSGIAGSLSSTAGKALRGQLEADGQESEFTAPDGTRHVFR